MLRFGGVTKALLVLHAAAAIALIGSATHGAVLAVRNLLGLAPRPKLQRTYASVTAVAYLVCFVLGLVIYPAFRVDVRAAYFDPQLPLATGFFEVKEHWLGVGLLALGVFWPLSRRIDLRSDTPEVWAFSILAITLGVVVWFATFTGLGLVALKPV